MIGILTLGLAFTATRTGPAYGRIVSTAQTFRHYFQDLNSAENSLNPVERFLFSLVLTNSTPQRTETPIAPART